MTAHTHLQAEAETIASHGSLVYKDSSDYILSWRSTRGALKIPPGLLSCLKNYGIFRKTHRGQRQRPHSIPVRITQHRQMAGTKPRSRHQSAGAHTNNLVSVGLIRWDLPTIIRTNVHGALSSKLDEIAPLSYKEQADIVCITETCCMPGKVPMTTVELPGYTSVRRDRKDGRGGGGIIAYIRDSIPFHQRKELDGPQSTDLETIWRRARRTSKRSRVRSPAALNMLLR